MWQAEQGWQGQAVGSTEVAAALPGARRDTQTRCTCHAEGDTGNITFPRAVAENDKECPLWAQMYKKESILSAAALDRMRIVGFCIQNQISLNWQAAPRRCCGESFQSRSEGIDTVLKTAMKSPGFLPPSQALCRAQRAQPGPAMATSPRYRPHKRGIHGLRLPQHWFMARRTDSDVSCCRGKGKRDRGHEQKGICLSNFRLFLSLIGTRSCQAVFKSRLYRHLLNCGRSKPIIVLPPGTFLLQRDLTVDILWTLFLPIKAANSSFSGFFKGRGGQ